jgi:hypothetical protein
LLFQKLVVDSIRNLLFKIWIREPNAHQSIFISDF